MYRCDIIQIVCNFIILINQSGASFIDTHHPIIISDGTTNNDEKSYFGYSIAGFSASASNRVSVYIGAPKSQRRTLRGTTVDTGDVWECQVNLAEDANVPNRRMSISCTPWNGLSKASSTQRCCGTQTRCVTEYTNGMWLGGSLAAIDENSFLACAPRWATQKNKDRAVHGFCYRAQTGNGNVQGLEPPLQYWDQLTNSGTLIWFYGQTGFSSAVDHSKTLMLAGAPGYLGWQGNAILYNLDETPQSCQPGSQFNTVYKTNSRRRTSGDSADYFGYYVASGQNSFGQATVFGVGAPRGHGEKDKHMAGSASLISVTRRNIHGAPLMGIHDVVLGEQLGSYFGAVVAFVDVNGNGEDEMFVGAPFYTVTVGHSSESYDEGCVFVYSKSILVEKLCPSSESGSRFGSAIASLGDIDHDGFIDIAIGSPGSASGQGEVYIYYGHPNFPNSRENSPQIIRVPELNDNFRGFGSTLFGNIDLDKNGTPDLLIGASSTNQIVIYRTRPRLTLQPVVTNFHIRADSPAIYKLKREDLSFRLLFCVSSQLQPENDGKLEIQVEAKFDSSEERYQFNNKMKIIKFSLQVITNAAPSCTNVHVNRVKEVEIQNPASIRIGWTMSYNNTISEILEISKLSVTSNAQGRDSPGNIFCTWCPKSMEQFHDHFLPVAIDNCDEDGNEICNSKLKVVASLRPIKGIDNDKLNEYTIGPHGPRFLDVHIENQGETAYSPNVVVNVSFSNPTLSNSFIIRPTLDGNHKCYVNNNKVVCRDPLHRGQKEHLSFIITISQTLAALKNEETIEITITAFPGPYPQQMQISNPVTFKLISDVKLTLTELNAERKDISINEANAVFRSSYEIINSGLSPINNLHFKFQIPVTHVRNDEEQQAIIVYMPKPYNKISCVPPNPQGFPPLPAIVIKNPPSDTPTMEFPNVTISEVTPNIGISRRRRQTQSERGQTDAQQSGKSVAENMLDVDCVKASQWKCIDVDCSLTSPLIFREPLIIELILKFSKNATNNNNIIPSESTVFVRTFAKMWTFDDNYNLLEASAVTVLQSESHGDLPAYLVFVSGIGGLIIFLLIAFLMFKCGFFRRKTKENLANLKAQAEQADLLAENFHVPPDDPNDE